MRKINRLIPNFRRDDLSPERLFPFVCPFDLTAKQLGVREVIYGVVYAATVVIGYYTGI